MQINELPDNVRKVAQGAIEAMQAGQCIFTTYRTSAGVLEDKTLEVHAVGTSSKGKPCMRAYQTMGGVTFSGAEQGWKMLSLEGVETMQILPGMPSQGPRPGFTPGDKGMGTIFAEISNEPVPAG
jgi:hypothetical protein